MNILKRLAMCVYLPLISLFFYWRELDFNNNDSHLLLGLAVAVLLSIGLFFYVPIAQRIEPKSIAWGLFWFIVIMLGGFGLISMVGDEAWGFSLFFFACFAPSYHEVCRLQIKKYKYSFFKAPEKLEGIAGR